MQHFGKVKNITMKGEADPVSHVDQECERIIVEGIRQHFPEHSILAEEGGAQESPSEWEWIIDPLDGTVNYVQGYPLFCTCIALCCNGVPELGVVYEPNRDEMFVAQRGQGATMNGSAIKVSNCAELLNSVLVTGFAYDRERGELEVNIPIFNAMLTKTRAVRRDGSAGVDLAYVACGRFDGFWEYYLNAWDITAGTLLVQEAGGVLSSCSGDALDLFGTELVASNGHLHEQVLAVIAQAQA